MIRCAVLGYGGAFNMGKAHAESMNQAGMTTVAACDLDPKRMEAAAADFPGIRTYTNYDEMLKDPEIDLVVSILPHNVHAETCIKASNAGKHVVVEKPMCMTVAEADAMIEAAQKAGKMLSVFHNRRWDGDFRKIREIIESGEIGEVYQIEACMGGYHGPGNWWRDSKEISGGVMFDWGAHVIDWIFHLIPQPMVHVDGFYQKLVWHEITNEDHGALTIRFANNASASVEMSSIDAAPKARWRILGSKGSIVMPGWSDIEVTFSHKGNLAKYTVKPLESNWQGYYDNIADHLMKGGDLVVKPEESRRIIAAIEASEESSRAGHSIAPKYL